MKKIFLITLGIVLYGVFFDSVSAETISYKRLDNIYFNLNVDGVSSSNHVTMFYLDNRLAYCIEPGAAINTKTYDSTSDWSKVDLDDETQKYLEKLGYYGYEYINHQTPKYYIATQELIWKAIKNIDVYWTTAKDGGGSVIDVTQEKNEILSLIKQHETLPSFTNDIISGEKGSIITVNDENMALQNYDVSQGNYHKIEKQDNKLIITLNNDNVEESFSLTKNNNNYYKDLLLVYTKSGSQSLASLRISAPEIYNFKVKSVSIPKETPKKEIVRVPSTGDNYQTFHYQTLKFYKYDFSRYN